MFKRKGIQVGGSAGVRKDRGIILHSCTPPVFLEWSQSFRGPFVTFYSVWLTHLLKGGHLICACAFLHVQEEEKTQNKTHHNATPWHSCTRLPEKVLLRTEQKQWNLRRNLGAQKHTRDKIDFQTLPNTFACGYMLSTVRLYMFVYASGGPSRPSLLA